MFGLDNDNQEKIEPTFDTIESGSQEKMPELADILGAEESDTNITAGVDAILDDQEALPDIEETMISENSGELEIEASLSGNEEQANVADFSDEHSENESLDKILDDDHADSNFSGDVETVESEVINPVDETTEVVESEDINPVKEDTEEVDVEDINPVDETTEVVESEDINSVEEATEEIESEIVNSEEILIPKDDGEKIKASRILWRILPSNHMSENPKIIDENCGFVVHQGNKNQPDLKIRVNRKDDVSYWRLFIINSFEISLTAQTAALQINKEEDVIRYASLMRDGEEQIKIFNQAVYKFIPSRDAVFSVQGNIICGQLSKDCSLIIQDYVPMTLSDKLNQTIKFDVPVSGIICGPKNTNVFFANVNALMIAVDQINEDSDIIEYFPSLDNFDDRDSFVYDLDSSEEEFFAQGKKNCLLINVGKSLFGWNVRFDNETYMSLRDVLEYQSKYKQLPSLNGEVIYGDKRLKFFNVEKIQIREKINYYAYGRL